MFKSIRGQFLIAGKSMRDSHFYKSVVLIVEHTEEGAMGLVVNRPSSLHVSHALSGHFDLPDTDDLIFSGGPVEPAALFILHNSPEFDATEISVIPDVYVGSSPEAFERIIRATASGDHPDIDFRVFSGCAGWGAGQLEDEMERGDWYTHSATSKRLFQANAYSIWDDELLQIYKTNRLFPYSPSDPEWN